MYIEKILNKAKTLNNEYDKMKGNLTEAADYKEIDSTVKSVMDSLVKLSQNLYNFLMENMDDKDAAYKLYSESLEQFYHDEINNKLGD